MIAQNLNADTAALKITQFTSRLPSASSITHFTLRNMHYAIPHFAYGPHIDMPDSLLSQFWLKLDELPEMK